MSITGIFDLPKPISKYSLFVFDLDGTLYSQSKLRKKLVIALIFKFLTFSLKRIDYKIISEFRKQREMHKAYTSPALESEQYEWVADKLKVPPETVAKTIDKWMGDFPLNYLRSCRYTGIDLCFNELKKKQKKIAVYSDYPADEKLKALDLVAHAAFCSTDKQISQLKPGKKGLTYICSQFNIAPEKTIFIGDRTDTDGESAKLAGTDFLKVNVHEASGGIFFMRLLNQLKSDYE